jgi:hypothetical protein
VYEDDVKRTSISATRDEARNSNGLLSYPWLREDVRNTNFDVRPGTNKSFTPLDSAYGHMKWNKKLVLIST